MTGSYIPLMDGGNGEAMTLARKFASFAEQELISDRPWAKTYRLAGARPVCLLKILPQRQARVPGFAAATFGAGL